MDMQMPVMDGLAAARAIREAMGDRAPPIVALTANAMKADVDRCLAAGMVDFVAKPIDRALLFKALRRHLPSAAAPGTPPSPGRPPSPAPGGVPEGVDEAEARARLGLSEEAFRRILARFTEALPATLAALRDAVAAGDREAAVRHAHSIAGSAGNVGAAALHGAAKGLEGALREGAADAAGALAAVEERAAGILRPPGGGDPPAAADRPPAAGAGAPIPAAVAAEARARAGALREALGSGDLDAIEAATASLKALPIPSAAAAALREVEAAAANFEFEKADRSLEAWLRGL
jgi:HPt (histidine-containing phosphotransfer) domain-containing protein